jgi:AraC-like DNA-binding protein
MTAPPGNLADRPAAGSEGPDGPDSPSGSGGQQSPPHDLLSELLRSVRLSGEKVVAHASPQPFAIGFSDMGALHIIEQGEVAIQIDGRPQVERVRRGDFVLLPRGDRHAISGDGASGPVRWLCGTFTIGDREASHLLGSLPAVIILRGGDGAALEALEGLEVARRMLVLEMQSPSQGSAVMVSRILDLIFIQIMRTWAAGADAEPNWLAGAFDPQIGLALSAIHRDPGREWSVEELARVSNLSRSSFAARFVTRVGKPPATYLAHVRLDAATTLLRDTFLPIAHIAEKVGYTSEAAFSRAFKNRYGAPPITVRRK